MSAKTHEKIQCSMSVTVGVVQSRSPCRVLGLCQLMKLRDSECVSLPFYSWNVWDSLVFSGSGLHSYFLINFILGSRIFCSKLKALIIL